MSSWQRVVRMKRLDALHLRLSVIAALTAVLVLDAVVVSDWPMPVLGLLDEIGHLATAWVLLVAVLPHSSRPLVPWALLGAVLIDVDHVPLYVWGVGTASDSQGRPITHSMTVVLVLLALSRLLGRLRTPLSGLALGVALHLVRDVSTGPGAPLFWPIAGTSVRTPYAFYVGLLCLSTASAMLRPLRRHPPAAEPQPLV